MIKAHRTDLHHNTLKVPKSDIEVVKGLKSRERTAIIRMGLNIIPTVELERIKSLLLNGAQ
ncbi:uncharacterized protein M421DRAFT_418603 [Didymella exigua CBS 183.55]|uniref:Uncharacterized protein n=1 Tax=Didymella exigua CBS 183.55 TaxID=1150837 RepID=A0A6A5RTE5_9PLEO|nr:uncharacterized protein M421DRAFT_418603 [Didymella exigua CBS 183.55]KAF1930288.1 hypothetical protein M421DRAFT_418603 [Didymella exigua CBS 183.55]